MRARHRMYACTEGVWTVRARWDASTDSCMVVAWDTTFLAVFYLYSQSSPPLSLPPPPSFLLPFPPPLPRSSPLGTLTHMRTYGSVRVRRANSARDALRRPARARAAGGQQAVGRRERPLRPGHRVRRCHWRGELACCGACVSGSERCVLVLFPSLAGYGLQARGY